MNLEEFAQYHEIKTHAQQGFAYNVYLCAIPQDFERVRPHWHEQFEIIYLKRGTGVVTVDLQPYPVAAGDIVPVLPGRLHSIEGSSERLEYENMIFSLEMLEGREDAWCRDACLVPLREGRLAVPDVIRPGTERYEETAACLDEMDRLGEKRQPGYPLLIKSELFRLLSLFYRYGPSKNGPAAARKTERLKNLLGWVQEHYGQAVTVAQAAEIIGYSPAHFMRFFRACTGQTFVQYLTDYRLAAARRLLIETDDSIETIAAECGFQNLSYFYRCFKRRYGAAPRSVRRG